MAVKQKVRTTVAIYDGEPISIDAALVIRDRAKKDRRAHLFRCVACNGRVIALAGGNGLDDDGGAHFEHARGVNSKEARLIRCKGQRSVSASSFASSTVA